VDVLKSKLSANPSSGISLRRGLVVFQFIIAQALIAGTLIIARQMNYFMDQPLGFDKDAVINVPFRVDTSFFKRQDYLKQQLLALNGVKAVCFSSNTPVEDGNDMWSTLKFDHATKEADFKAITKFADEEYVPAYKLQLIAGRNLQPSKFTREFLVNETLMKSLGISEPEEILNREISIWGDKIKCPVVGVLKDFNDRSFRNDLAPLLITTNGTMYSQAGIKLDTKDISATLKSVKSIWEKTIPNFVYEYRFLDEKIEGFYKQESQLAQLYKIFSAIAIFLSCLGLYGLALFMAIQRTKEVGIRKVHGASAANIVYLFSKEFIMLILIAFAIATPIAWFYMRHWLQEYAYRINVGWELFATGGLIALIIAVVTISYQAIKAAFANPVNSLRIE
jgi:ABC-type antimicrobial peptide transport system permease subunit